MNKISSLISFLHKNGFFTAELEIRKLAGPDLDNYQREISRAAYNRESPFSGWFPSEQRVYIPYQVSIDLEAYASDKFDVLQEYLEDFGHNWSFLEIFNGRRGSNEKLNYKWIKRNIIKPYSKKIYSSGVLDLFSNFSSEADFLNYLFKIHDLFVLNNYSKLRESFYSVDNVMNEWGYQAGDESTPMQEYERRHKAEETINKIKKFMVDLYDELDEFFNDPIRTGKSEDLEVVISIKKEDIAAMSTGRRWSSCMTLGSDSGYYKNVFCEIKDGGFVAYLISKNDRNIDDPLARLHIRRFDSADGKSVAVPESGIYSSGEDYPDLIRIVKKWIKEKQGEIIPGEYVLSGGSQSDTFSNTEYFGLEEEVTPESSMQMLRDPSTYLLNKYDIKDVWIVEDSFYNNWYGYFKEEERDDEEQGEPVKIFNFDFLEKDKIFSSEEAAKNWVIENSEEKEVLKNIVRSSIDKWNYNKEIEHEQMYAYDEDHEYEYDYMEQDEILKWIDQNNRYTITKKNAMERVSEMANAVVESQKTKIYEDIVGKGSYYYYFKANKDDLKYFYDLYSDAYHKKKIYMLYPEDLEYQLEDELDFSEIADIFQNIHDISAKKEKAKEIKAIIDSGLTYDNIIGPIVENQKSSNPYHERPVQFYFERLIRPIYNSRLIRGTVNFGNDFSQKMEQILDDVYNESRYEEIHLPHIIRKVEDIVFGAMQAYKAHDPFALRIYARKLEEGIRLLENPAIHPDSEAKFSDLANALSSVSKFIDKIKHLEESGIILIDKLEKIYHICNLIINEEYDYTNFENIKSKTELNLITLSLKRESKSLMKKIRILVSRINKTKINRD